MKANYKYGKSIAAMACLTIVCVTETAMGAQEASPDLQSKNSTDTSLTRGASPCAGNADDSVSVYLGKYHPVQYYQAQVSDDRGSGLVLSICNIKMK